MRDARFLFGAVIVLTVALMITLALVVFVGGNTLSSSTDAVHRADAAVTQADAALSQSVQANQLSQATAADRKASLIAFCAATNETHHNTIRRLDQILRAAEKREPQHRRTIQASRASTVLLINALAPERNCVRYVNSQTKS